MTDESKTIAQNRKAYHDYFVLETYEAGIELFGTEIKSIRAGRVNLKDSFCSVDDGEMYAIGMHISPYEQGNRFNRDPMRKKKLLLHKKEINKLFAESQQQGLSIIPLQLYIRKGRAKLQIGLCKGKKMYDKRAVQAKKDSDRAIERAMKGNY
ncbi:MAG: SsrA-binding protein SmpB [Eubacterium sp.]|nr:SsrA-binding protein SmpB [Oscillospiraceae bacterium]MDY4608860.1 SsrA-binding protein SmpB [Eubacterium sp.]